MTRKTQAKYYSVRASQDKKPSPYFRKPGIRLFEFFTPVLILYSSLFSQDNWTRRNPLPTDASLLDVVWTGTQAVAVGCDGIIVTSPDGVSWTNQISGTKKAILGLTWTGNKLVAVGENGTILVSGDGAVWTSRVSGTKTNLNAVACHGGQLVALGGMDTILTSSSDGETWAVGSTGSKSNLFEIVWGDSQFVAIGDSVLTSSDGQSWTAHSNGRSKKNAVLGADIAWSGNRFVAALVVADSECIVTSTDGRSWSVCPVADNLLLFQCLAWAGDKFVMSEAKDIYTSTDGLQWHSSIDPSADRFSNKMIWTGNQLIAVGVLGAIKTSTDDTTWMERDIGVHEDILDVTKGNDLLVAVGQNGLIITSPDGVTWTRRPSGTTSGIYSIVYNGKEFTAVGFKGLVMTSTTGIDWTTVSTGFAHFLGDVVWSGTQFVAVGAHAVDSTGYYRSPDNYINGSVIYTSPDGVVWTEQPGGSKGSWLFGVTWTGSQFVSAGYLGTIITSPDGVTWTDHSPGSIGTYWVFSSIAWNDNQIVAAGCDDWNGKGIIAVSKDSGATWSRKYINDVRNLTNIAWTGNEFLATGQDGEILTSPDGETWTLYQSGTVYPFNGIAVTKTQLVLVGNCGNIFSSPLEPTSISNFSSRKTVPFRFNLTITSVRRDGIRFIGNFPQLSPISLTLFNLLGKRLLQTRVSLNRAGRQSVDMHLPILGPGVYLLEVTTGGIIEKCTFNYHF